MTSIKQSWTKVLCSLLLIVPLSAFAQLGLPGGAAGGGAAPDLTCTSKGSDGKLSCGGVKLEQQADFCDDVDGDYICDSRDECPDTPAGTPVFMNGCHEMELRGDQPWVLRGVNFEFDRAVLLPQSVTVLDAAVNVLNSHPEILVSIDGHTDDKGSDQYNQNLSASRSKTVYQYFLDHGVSADRLVYRGYGESRPVAPNAYDDGSDNPEGRAENRRVELNVLDQEAFNAAKQDMAAMEEAARQASAERRRAATARRAAAEEAAAAEAEEAQAAAEEESQEKTESFDSSSYLDFAEEGASEESAVTEEAGTEESATEEAATAETESESVTEESADDAVSEEPAADEAAEESQPATEEQAGDSSVDDEFESLMSDSSTESAQASESTDDQAEGAGEESESSFNEDEYLNFLDSSESTEGE